jgi:molybdenum cofactor synthesis domain-containing protein
MKKKTLSVEDAVGAVLWHDVTRIVPGRVKGPAYRRGHVIRAEDVPVLLDLGKEHVYVLDLEQGDVHEDEAAVRLAKAVAGPGLRPSQPAESRVNLVATHDGVVRIDTRRLKRLNALSYLALATLHDATVVRKGDVVAALKPLPLVLSEEDVRRAVEFCQVRRGLVRVLPFRRLRVGVVVTGSEVARGHIKDEFGPVVTAKVEAFGSRVAGVVCVTDDPSAIARAIHDAVRSSDLVVVTGGMSVDPDDATPAGVRLSGASIERYGAPVMPGVMLLLAYLDAKPVLGVPACALYYPTTVLDLILPRLLAGERVTGAEIAALGHGGLCRTPAACIACTFPHCEFGKG